MALVLMRTIFESYEFVAQYFSCSPILFFQEVYHCYDVPVQGRKNVISEKKKDEESQKGNAVNMCAAIQ